MDVKPDLEEIAMDWLLRIEASRPNARTWARANAWLQADARHARAYQRAMDFWNALGETVAVASGLPVPKEPTQN